MNCLILAAGLGTRLRDVGESKPLTPVAGTPLIEHVIRRAVSAGATRFVVVTGHEADRVEGFLTDLAARLHVSIEPVRCEDWSRPNGYSVLAGSAAIKGPYLLSMSDHLFDPEIARGLLQLQPDGVCLAVDRNLSGPLLDIDDATKVELAADGRIVRIGKTLARYDAIDTGLFLATPALAKAIREAIAAGGSGSLSDGMQRLADAGRAHTMDIGGAQWIDVDSPRMLALADAWLTERPVTGSAA